MHTDQLSAQARRHISNLQHGEDYLWYKFWESLQTQLEEFVLTGDSGTAALEYFGFPNGFDDFAEKMLRLKHLTPSLYSNGGHQAFHF
jgi:hypothetical protein